MQLLRRSVLPAAVAIAVALVPVGTAHAGKRPPAPKPVATAPAPAPDTGPLDVTRLEVDTRVDAEDPSVVFGLAEITADLEVDAITIAVQPAGGTWTGALDFTHFGPLTLHSWQPVQLSSDRSLPAGVYEAHVAARQGSTWVHDERVTSFTVS